MHKLLLFITIFVVAHNSIPIANPSPLTSLTNSNLFTRLISLFFKYSPFSFEFFTILFFCRTFSVSCPATQAI